MEVVVFELLHEGCHSQRLVWNHRSSCWCWRWCHVAATADVKMIFNDCSDGWAFNVRYAKDREVSQRWEILCAAQALLAALCYEIRGACPAVQLLVAARGYHDAFLNVPGCMFADWTGGAELGLLLLHFLSFPF